MPFATTMKMADLSVNVCPGFLMKMVMERTVPIMTNAAKNVGLYRKIHRRMT